MLLREESGMVDQCVQVVKDMYEDSKRNKVCSGIMDDLLDLLVALLEI